MITRCSVRMEHLSLSRVIGAGLQDPDDPESVFVFNSPFEISHFDLSPDERWITFADPGPHHSGSVYVRAFPQN